MKTKRDKMMPDTFNRGQVEVKQLRKLLNKKAIKENTRKLRFHSIFKYFYYSILAEPPPLGLTTSCPFFTRPIRSMDTLQIGHVSNMDTLYTYIGHALNMFKVDHMKNVLDTSLTRGRHIRHTINLEKRYVQICRT